MLPLSQDNWRDVAFPKTSRFTRDTKLTCVEMLENVMPLAVGRPFVNESVTGLTKAKVSHYIFVAKRYPCSKPVRHVFIDC